MNLKTMSVEQFNVLAQVIPIRQNIFAVEALTEVKFKTIAAAFDEAMGGRRPDIQMCRRVIKYSIELASRDEHLTFYGGNLLGTDRIRMLPSDRDRWFDEVIGVDEEYLKDCIHSVPSINTDWVVTSDVFNLSVVWFLHHCFKTLNIKDKTVHQAVVESIVVLQFKFLSSIYSNYFAKPVDYEAAEATYANLTMKFNIKRLGSWGALMRERAEAMTSKDSPHYQMLRTFDDDDQILYFVTDLQTRTRKTIKDQYKVLDKVRRGNLRIQTTSQVVEMDGDRIIRDQVSAYNTAKRYLLDVSGNEASFIKNELVNVVLDIMGTVSRAGFIELLQVISNMPTGKQRDQMEELMSETLHHAFDHIVKNRIRFNDVGYILSKMRSLYMLSNDPKLDKIRKELERFAKRHSHLRASAALASARTSIMLYFLLRALSSNTYN